MNRLPNSDPDRDETPGEGFREIELPEHLHEFLRLRYREAMGHEAPDAEALGKFMWLQMALNAEARELMDQTLNRPEEEQRKINAFLDRKILEAVALGRTEPTAGVQELVTNDALPREAEKLEEN